MFKIFIRRRFTRPRLALASGCACWSLLTLVGWLVAMPPVSPDDPEFDIRRRQLAELRRTEPDRPLLLMLGSSRGRYAFRPEAMPTVLHDGQAMVPYNLARPGAGPTTNRELFRELLADDIRPSRLLLEVTPPFLMDEPIVSAKQPRYPWHHLWDALKRASEGRNPLARLSESATRSSASLRVAQPMPLGGDGTVPTAVSEAERSHKLATTRIYYARSLRSFHIHPDRDADLRAMLAECQRERVPVTLLIMPESGLFRSWYPSTAHRRIADYLGGLVADLGVGLIDAREWLPDSELPDGHHPLLSGAEAFTRRLAEELRTVTHH